jgi:HK97 gp10 family phage protein
VAEWLVEGADAIVAKLKKLADRPARNALRRALRKGARPIRDAARNNAKRIDDPESREQIWKNIAIAAGGKRREREEGGVVMRVGVQGGARFNPNADGPGGNTSGYWRFVEFGTSEMAAQPFLRPAGAEKAQAAFDVTAAAMQTELDKELAKVV